MKRLITILFFLSTQAHFNPLHSQIQTLKPVQSLHQAVSRYAPKLVFSEKESYFSAPVEYYLSGAKLVRPAYPRAEDLVDYGKITDDVIEEYKDDIGVHFKNLEARYGDLWNTKTYVHIRRAYYQHLPYFSDDIDIQYWFFFPYNGGQGIEEFFAHEGDWEHITVRINSSGDLIGVKMSQHQTDSWYRPEELEWGQDGHFRVYTANEGHALYKDGGYNHAKVPIADHCGGGHELRMWDERIEIISIDPSIKDHGIVPSNPKWLEFKGRWGWSRGGVTGPKQKQSWVGSDEKERYHINVFNAFSGSEIFNGSDELYGEVIVYDYTVKTEADPSDAIDGPKIICPGSPVTYSLNPQYSVTWSPANSNFWSSSQSNNETLTITPNNNGNRRLSTISAELLVSYGTYKILHKTSKSVWIGSPSATPFPISGPSSVQKGEVVTYTVAPSGNPDGSQFNWVLPYNDPGPCFGTNCWKILSGSNGAGFVQSQAGKNSGLVQVERYNKCGSIGFSTHQVTVQSTGSGGPGGGISLQRMINIENESETNQEEYSIPNLAVYPNPTTDKITIQFNDQLFDGSVSIDLIDLNGSVLSSSHGVYSGHELKTNNLKNGIYFIRVSDGDHIKFNRILKN